MQLRRQTCNILGSASRNTYLDVWFEAQLIYYDYFIGCGTKSVDILVELHASKTRYKDSHEDRNMSQ